MLESAPDELGVLPAAVGVSELAIILPKASEELSGHSPSCELAATAMAATTAIVLMRCMFASRLSREERCKPL